MPVTPSEAALAGLLKEDPTIADAAVMLDVRASGAAVVAARWHRVDPDATAAMLSAACGRDCAVVQVASLPFDGAEATRSWVLDRVLGVPVLPEVRPASPVLVVDELTLTRWARADLDELSALHSEAETMAPFGGPMATRRDSDLFAERVDGWFDRFGIGMFAVHDGSALLGAVGLAPVPPELSLPYAVEVGWRLRRAAWGRGVASRSATAALAWAKGACDVTEVCSFTVAVNERSQRVMRRIGLVRRGDLDFDHPGIAKDDERRAHVVYATPRGEGAAGSA